jgi:predicted CopG family antitoxin
MVKTITIKDEVYKKLLAQKGKVESFSDLFERLLDGNIHNDIDALKKIRGSIELIKKSKIKY